MKNLYHLVRWNLHSRIIEIPKLIRSAINIATHWPNIPEPPDSSPSCSGVEEVAHEVVPVRKMTIVRYKYSKRDIICEVTARCNGIKRARERESRLTRHLRRPLWRSKACWTRLSSPLAGTGICFRRLPRADRWRQQPCDTNIPPNQYITLWRHIFNDHTRIT